MRPGDHVDESEGYKLPKFRRKLVPVVEERERLVPGAVLHCSTKPFLAVWSVRLQKHLHVQAVSFGVVDEDVRRELRDDVLNQLAEHSVLRLRPLSSELRGEERHLGPAR